MLLSWTCCRRWQRAVHRIFYKTLHSERWKIDSHGLPVQLLPNKYPTWPAEMEHKVKIQPCHKCHKTAPLSQKSAASGAARTQDKELRDTIETAKSDFLTKLAEVDAFAALSSEQIYEQLNMVTVVNHLRPLCKSWGLVQSGRMEEVIDRIIAYIIEQSGTAGPTIKIKKGMKEEATAKMEIKTAIAGHAIPAHYTQECQQPRCQLKRGIAKHEPNAKVRPYGWCHQQCATGDTVKK